MKKFVICFMFCFCNLFVLINGANASNLKEYDSLNRLDQYRRAFGVQSNMANTMQGDPRYSGTVVTPKNPYKADMRGYAGVVDEWNAIARGLGYDVKPTNLTNDLANLAESQYRAQLANQIGVPYEVYVCQGNWQCLQQFELQRRQNQALQNQRIRIVANVNYRYNNNRYRY